MKDLEMETAKLFTVIFGATGLWTFLGFVLKQWLDRKWNFAKLNREQAEIRSINLQAENILLENWIDWCRQLEARVKDLEEVREQNFLLSGKVEAQRERIRSLEKQVEKLEKENLSLREELQSLLNERSEKK